jgi:hypothetical protein
LQHVRLSLRPAGSSRLPGLPDEPRLSGGVLPILRLPVGRPAQLSIGSFCRALADPGCTGQRQYSRPSRQKTIMSVIMYRLRRRLPHSHKHLSSLVSGAQYTATLADLRPGDSACLLSFSSEIAPERLTQLQSYGLLPGCHVRVQQNWPVIVVQVEHTELAIENDLARQIYLRGDSVAGL